MKEKRFMQLKTLEVPSPDKYNPSLHATTSFDRMPNYKFDKEKKNNYVDIQVK